MLSKGATTWWERCNSDTGDPAMNSYNHYALGSVMAWVYRYLVGIDTTQSGPGFHEIVVHPRLDGRITQASGAYNSIYGEVLANWNGTGAGLFSLSVTIPANTAAKVFIPAAGTGAVTAGGKPIKPDEEGDCYVGEIGSVSYTFQVK
jgi:alpha-L-rhamnosidase